VALAVERALHESHIMATTATRGRRTPGASAVNIVTEVLTKCDVVAENSVEDWVLSQRCGYKSKNHESVVNHPNGQTRDALVAVKEDAPITIDEPSDSESFTQFV